MNKLFSFLLLLLFAAILQGQNQKQTAVPNQIIGNPVQAGVYDYKMNGLLKKVIADMLLQKNHGSAAFTNQYSKNSTVPVYIGANGKPSIQVFIQNSNYAEAKQAIKASEGIIESVVGDIMVVSLPVESVVSVASAPAVRLMEASGINKTLLDSSIVATKVKSVHAGTSLPKAYKGKNVILGVIDSGIDWEHADFKDASGSRILYLWDMSRSGSAPTGYTYGYEYTKAKIDALQCIATDDNSGGGHGTHVAATAAGGGMALAQYTGMAPEADIIFVKGFRNGAYFSDADVINGCNYIFTKAQSLGKPAVINLSLGGQYGPHDGTSLYEKALSSLTGPGKLIVCAAGNEGGDNIHLSYAASGTSYSDAFETYWEIPQGESISQIDMWYNTGTISVGIAAYTQTGVAIGHTAPVAPGSKLVNALFTVNGTTYGRFTIDATATNNANNNAKEVYISLDDVNGAYNLSSVKWSIYTYGTGTFDSWVFSGGSFSTSTSTFFKSGDNAKSVGVPSTAMKTFSIGAYCTKKVWQSAAGPSYQFPDAVSGKIGGFSSMGPSRDGRRKPDFVAPGQVVAAALSADLTIGTGVAAEMIVTGGKHQVMQGTSMAAPHVSGVLALMLERNPTLDYAQAFNILTTTTVKDSYTGSTAGNVYGTGKMDALAAMLATPNSVSKNNLNSMDFMLYQNYPNPFNPETVIRYQIAVTSPVTLSVYDVLGNQVAVLVNGIQQAGPHEVAFSSAFVKNLSSGIYLYQLRAGASVLTNKMVLMK
ncbi:MAG: S8 family peptidase [Ignavibacteriales bacterium]|nr:S8 family peptidase [Ignavibacteriales bacterium]